MNKIVMSKNKINLIPYLHFTGNCEEALKSYKSILGGRFEIQSRYDNSSVHVPEGFQNKVVHARFYINAFLFMAADVFFEQNEKNGLPIALSLDLYDMKKAQSIYSKFSEEGEVHIPFEKQFWGDWHGNLTDQYGIRWMINYIED
jgi:PhnB protein